MDLSKYLEKNIRVKFAGGRETAGILKGYDPLLNLVLDNTTEYLRGINIFILYLSSLQLTSSYLSGGNILSNHKSSVFSKMNWNDVFLPFLNRSRRSLQTQSRHENVRSRSVSRNFRSFDMSRWRHGIDTESVYTTRRLTPWFCTSPENGTLRSFLHKVIRILKDSSYFCLLRYFVNLF